MRVAHVSWLLSRAGGGIPPVAFSLAAAERLQGLDARVLGVRDPTAPPLPAPSVPRAVFPSIGPVALGYAPALAAAIRDDPPDVLHLHGLFTWSSRITRGWGRRSEGPVVVSPHGMLEPWALANSAWKKRLFWHLVERDNLRGASCLHGLCLPEARNFRSLGLRNPIAIIPNGVDLLEMPSPLPRAAFDALFPVAAGRRSLLFLGRIHPKKGLLHLLDAWATVKAEGRLGPDGWLLVVAGPDQLGHASEVQARTRAHGLEQDVIFTGQLHGEAKWAALSAAEGFILPSFSEGFSVAVLEAMAFRIPVLLTRQCNLDVEALGAGLLCEPDASSVAKQLRSFLALEEKGRRMLGEKGRRAVEERYNWQAIARDMGNVYAWLLGAGQRPSCVEVSA